VFAVESVDPEFPLLPPFFTPVELPVVLPVVPLRDCAALLALFGDDGSLPHAVASNAASANAAA
jgi:hypothetical protein